MYKESIPLEIEVRAETDNDAFHFHRYRHEIVGMVKKTMSEFSCEEVINNPQKIEEIVKSRFRKPKATLSFLTITITPPVEFIEAGKALKTASLTVQKDSLISASAKKDAVVILLKQKGWKKDATEDLMLKKNAKLRCAKLKQMKKNKNASSRSLRKCC